MENSTIFTMVGASGAGKTCYITAMYAKMATGFDGFTLVTDDATRVQLEKNIYNLRKPDGKSRFPQATPEEYTRTFDFRLSYDLKRIINFSIMDYAGGILMSREGTFEKFKSSLAESTALYIFIDGESLCDKDRTERLENVRYDCALTTTPLIQDFADTHGGVLPPIVFVITKSDRCMNYVNDDEIISILRDLFSPAFAVGTTTYVCGVSLGRNISDNDYKGRFAPVNIHIPFFIGCYHEYLNRCVALTEEINKTNGELGEQSAAWKASMEKEKKKWRIFRKDDFIKKCADRAKKADSDIKTNTALLIASRTLLIKLGTRLETESSTFHTFIDGIEQGRFKPVE